MRELAQKMNALCDALPFQTSWYLKDLVTGERADRLGDTPVPSASTRKISIMMAALKAVHDGKLSLDQKVTIEAKYQDNDSGTFQHLTPGFWITFRDALVMMIIVSDNTCTGTVVDMVGLDAIQRYCDAAGMTRTVHRFGIPPKLGPDHTLDQVTTTTPNDQGLLLEAMLRGAEDKAAAARLGVIPELSAGSASTSSRGRSSRRGSRRSCRWAPRWRTRRARARAATWTPASSTATGSRSSS
jgi:beta-lactamase class A